MQIRVPDVSAEGSATEADQQSRAIAASDAAEDDQACVDGCLSDLRGETAEI